MKAIKCIDWYYCGKNGTQAEEPDTYEEFIKLNIKVEWHEYIDTTKLEAKRKTGIQKAVKRKTQNKQMKELTEKVENLEKQQLRGT
jgi:hypothetical protein